MNDKPIAALSATPQAPADAEIMARQFHEAYERLSPSFGYTTRPETRDFDPASPNGRLMIAVCALLATKASASDAEPVLWQICFVTGGGNRLRWVNIEPSDVPAWLRSVQNDPEDYAIRALYEGPQPPESVQAQQAIQAREDGR